MKKLIFALLLMVCGFATNANASKAVSCWRPVTLQDGRQVMVSLFGDEHYSFYATAQGELVIREGNLFRLATEIEKTESKKAIERVMKKTNEGIYATRPFPHEGHPRALVIMASFSDRDFIYSKSDIDKLFNGTETDTTSGYHSYSSLAQYMDDCSDGKYRPLFDVVGPYQLKDTLGYYGKNGGSSDCNTDVFVKEACQAADADGVDFSQYDADKDGFVDLVYVVYAGYGENWGGSVNYLWPKAGTGNFGTYDGKTVFRYGINNELTGYEGITGDDGKPMLNGIGVLTHEFCHTLGLPDVYPTNSWSDVTKYDDQSMEYWDLMDNGENNRNGYDPTPLTAFERELFGWISIETITDPQDITLKPLQDGGKAYRILNDNDASGNEYYILEAIPNGTGTGWYKWMRGNGMLVTHINYSTSTFGNFSNPNNTDGKPRWTIIPADGILMSSYRMSTNNDGSYKYPDYAITRTEYNADHAGDPYPGTSNVTELTDYKAYSGTVDKPITDITQNGFEVSFKFCGGGTANIVEYLNPTLKDGESEQYNLSGQRVSNNYKGIVISNGKKILVK